MTIFGKLAQDWPDDMVAPIIMARGDLIAGLRAGEFDQIAIFEMISDTFQQSMYEFVRQLRQEADAAISVVVLVERL